MAKSPEEMKAAMIAGLKEKTGKSLDEWLAILKKTGLGKHKEFMGVLKGEHGLTHGFANMIALQALQSDSHTATDTDSLVASEQSVALPEPILEVWSPQQAAALFDDKGRPPFSRDVAAEHRQKLLNWRAVPKTAACSPAP